MGVVLAMFMLVSVSLCALAVDMASLYLERRTAQGVADLAAVAAASDLNRAENAARATLTANGFGDVRSLAITKGRYDADPSVAAGSRFVAGRLPYNAVKLDMALGGQLYFAKTIMDDPQISVSAVGTTDAQAMFSIGSRLASVQGGILNSLLKSLLGGNVSLSVMDYNALLNANVSMSSLLSALATQIGISAGTFNQVLATNVSVAKVFSAAATAAARGGQSQAASVLTTLASQATSGATIKLSTLVDLGPLAFAEIGQSHAGLDSAINLMSLLSAVAQAANGTNQVAFDLGTAIPGLLSLKMNLAIGEPTQNSGWVAVGQPGATLKTAQTRLRLVAEVAGTGLLAGVRVRLPLYIELAQAEAKLKALTCNVAQPSTARAVLDAKPAVVKAWIGDVTPSNMSSFGSSVPVSNGSIAQALLVTVSASAYTEMSNTSATEMTFTQQDVDGRTIKKAYVQNFTSTLVSSLLRNANLNVNILGFAVGLNVPAVKSLVLSLLTPVASALDPLVLSLLETVGVRLGEVDVQVHGIRCGSAVLAG